MATVVTSTVVGIRGDKYHVQITLTGEGSWDDYVDAVAYDTDGDAILAPLVARWLEQRDASLDVIAEVPIEKLAQVEHSTNTTKLEEKQAELAELARLESIP